MSLEELASAASQARPRRKPAARGRATRRVPARPSSAPVVLAIVFGAILIGGAIVFFAMRGKSTAGSQAAADDPQAVAAQRAANEAANQDVRAQRADFEAFARLLQHAMARTRKAALQADSAGSGTVVNYTCDYLLGHMGTQNAASGRPTQFLVQFSGTIEGKGEGFSSSDTCQVNAAFIPVGSGRWMIDHATEITLTHKTSADLFGVPEKGGQQRDITHIDWFNFAVNDAIAASQPQH